MKPCSRCRRHVRRAELACPFCGAALHDTHAPTAWTLGLMVLTASCVPADPPLTGDDGGDSTTRASTSGASDPTTTTDESSTSSSSHDSTGECGTACSDSYESGAFIYAPWGDMGDPLQCDNFLQDCPAGMKCAAWAHDGGGSWNALQCVPVAPNPRQPGEPCIAESGGVAGLDDCDVGVMCWDVNADNIGTCVALCTGTADMPHCDDPTKTCALSNQAVLNLCLPTCDPLLQDCVEMDDVCIQTKGTQGFVCILDASGDEGQQHDPCQFANACDPGLWCADNTAASECDDNQPGCCQPFCDLTDPDVMCTGAGQACIPFFPMGDAPDGLDDVGFCSLPP